MAERRILEKLSISVRIVLASVLIMLMVMAASRANISISLYFIFQMITLGMIVLGCIITFVDFKNIELYPLIKRGVYGIVVCSVLFGVLGVICALFLRQRYNIDFVDSILSTIVLHLGQPILSVIASYLEQPVEYYTTSYNIVITCVLFVLFAVLCCVLAMLWRNFFILCGKIILVIMAVSYVGFAADIGFNGYTFEFLFGWVDTWIFKGATGEGVWRVLQGIFYTFIMLIWFLIYVVINMFIMLLAFLLCWMAYKIIAELARQEKLKQKGATAVFSGPPSGFLDRELWNKGAQEGREGKREQLTGELKNGYK